MDLIQAKLDTMPKVKDKGKGKGGGKPAAKAKPTPAAKEKVITVLLSPVPSENSYWL